MKTLEEALAEADIAKYPQAFQTAMGFIIPHEVAFKDGHYDDYDFILTENVAGDQGQATRYGVDQTSHPGIDVAALDLPGALAIYWQEWQSHRLDALPDKLAILAMDVWVNGGSANLWLQQAYNLTLPNGTEQLEEDGWIGKATLEALARCDEKEVVLNFCALRADRFRRLAQKPSRAHFFAGWIARNDDLKALLA